LLTESHFFLTHVLKLLDDGAVVSVVVVHAEIPIGTSFPSNFVVLWLILLFYVKKIIAK
jgi:hypothetical protein